MKLFLGLLLAAASQAVADKAPSNPDTYGSPKAPAKPAPAVPSYSAPAPASPPAPQVKYGGPIVYSGEKPPIIHFPPPPPQVSCLSPLRFVVFLKEFSFFSEPDLIWIWRRKRKSPSHQVCSTASP